MPNPIPSPLGPRASHAFQRMTYSWQEEPELCNPERVGMLPPISRPGGSREEARTTATTSPQPEHRVNAPVPSAAADTLVKEMTTLTTSLWGGGSIGPLTVTIAELNLKVKSWMRLYLRRRRPGDTTARQASATYSF